MNTIHTTNLVNNKTQKKSFIFDATILLILFLSGGFLTSNDVIPPTVSKLLWVVVFAILVLICRVKNNRSIIGFVLFSTTIILSTVINGGILTNSIFICIGAIACFLIVSSFSFEFVSESYNRVMAFLCLFSLIMTALFFIFPSLNTLFRVSNANNTATYSNFIFFVKNNNETGLGRNWGMFWEPGAFQTFICFALLFEFSKKRPSILLIILYSITIASTFSTTGYFAMALLYVYGFIKNYKNNKILRRTIIFIVAAFAFVLLLNYDYFFSTSSYSAFGKLVLYNTSTWYHENITSVTIRINSIIKPIGLFFTNPIFGLGDSVFREVMYKDTLGVTSCTLINWFAVYGIFPGIFVTYSIIKTSIKLSSSIICRIIIFIIIFVITLSENYLTNVAVLLLMTLGYSLTSDNLEAKNENVIETKSPDSPLRIQTLR